MSSPNGDTLEDFVEEGLIRPTSALVEKWVDRFEPYRKQIEGAVFEWYMADARGEAQSWRDFRNQLWGTYEARTVPAQVTEEGK